MTGRRSRQKGHSYERKLAKLFTETLGVKCKRGIQFRYGAKEGCDVEGVSWLHIEAKRHKVANIRAALRQAEDDNEIGRVPVAITKDDRGPDLVTMRLEHFLPMAQLVHYILFSESDS